MNARRFKMRDVERMTGIGRETIRFYIRAGLLPEPERPGRNVAWYDANFVERLRLVRELREKRFLPLHVIKAIVGSGAGPSRDEVQTLLELDGKLFPAVDGRPPAAAETVAAVARRTGVSAADVRALADVGALEIATQGGRTRLEEPAVRLVEQWGRMRRAGFTEALGFGPGQLRVYVDMVRWLAREELRMFTQGVTGRVPTERAARMAEEGITVLNQVLGLLRRATLLRYIAEGNVPDGEVETGRAVGAVRRTR